MLSAVIGLALAVVVIIAVPGPSVLFIVGQALAGGRRPALLSMLGNAIGTLAAGLVVCLLLGALIERLAWLQTVLALAGAAVLVLLGIQYLVGARREWKAGEVEGEVVATVPRRPFVSGLTVGVTNPKVAIMYGTIVPGFLPPGANPWTGLLLLALVPTAVGLVSDSVWVELSSRARAWLTGSANSQAVIKAVGGVLLIVLAVVLGAEALRG